MWSLKNYPKLYQRALPIFRLFQSSHNKGTILLTVIIVLIFLAVLGMSLLGLLFSRTTLATLAIDRLKAFYLAEAGIAKSINELRTDIDSDGNGIGNVLATKLGEGRFWATHNFQTSTITAVGEVNKVKRTLQIKYTVF
jgi:Tfp pilus assembly protein PilX